MDRQAAGIGQDHRDASPHRGHDRRVPPREQAVKNDETEELCGKPNTISTPGLRKTSTFKRAIANTRPLSSAPPKSKSSTRRMKRWAGDQGLLKKNQELLVFYRAHQPYHETTNP